MKPLDDGLKQRLLGALVLLALAVIFLPVLFDRDPMVPVDRNSQIPNPPEVFTVQISPAEVPELEDLAPPPETMYVPEETRAVDIAPDAPGLAADGTPKSWVLQIASFREEALAEAMRQKLSAAGYSAYTRQVAYKNGTIVRVYVGPKLDKEALVRDKKLIDEQFVIQSLLLPFTPN